MEKMVIGVTGSIGTGKSTVCKIIKDLGYEVIDCDEISHNCLVKDPGYTQVVEAFGSEILNEDDTISRQKLGKIVFNDMTDRALLERIMHPIIYRDIEAIIKKSTSKLIFIDCPLLFETNFTELCTYTLVVYTDLDRQIQRIMKRDGFTFPEALARIYTQMPLDVKMDKADFIIDNSHFESDLSWQVTQLIQSLEKKN